MLIALLACALATPGKVNWADLRSQTSTLAGGTTCINRRPLPDDRTFVSKVVDAAVEAIASTLKDDTLACVFRNTAANTLDTTISRFTTGLETSNLG